MSISPLITSLYNMLSCISVKAMSSNYQNILQITSSTDNATIDMAHKCARERFSRLTARGPLKFFRHDLLTTADKAHRALKHPAPKAAQRPLSLLARRVASWQHKSPDKTPTRSNITSGSILTGRPLEINAPLLKQAKKQQNLTEDKYCCEILYRIEGDLIRFDSRRELLKIADKWKIPLFRANMLIAQIVQSVRQYNLYQPTTLELQLYRQFRNISSNLLKIDKPKGSIRRQWLTIATIIAIIIIIETFLLLQ